MKTALIALIASGLAVAGPAVASSAAPKTGVWKGQLATTTLSFDVSKKGKVERVSGFAGAGEIAGCEPKILNVVKEIPAARIAPNGSFKAVFAQSGASDTVTGRFTSKTKASGTVVVKVEGLCTSTFTWSATR